MRGEAGWSELAVGSLRLFAGGMTCDVDFPNSLTRIDSRVSIEPLTLVFTTSLFISMKTSIPYP